MLRLLLNLRLHLLLLLLLDNNRTRRRQGRWWWLRISITLLLGIWNRTHTGHNR